MLSLIAHAFDLRQVSESRFLRQAVHRHTAKPRLIRTCGQQPDRRECSTALRKAESGKIRQDSVDRAVDIRWRSGRAAHSEAVELSRWRVKKTTCPYSV